MFVLEVLFLHLQELRLLAEELLRLPSYSGIIPGQLRGDGRGESFSAGQGLWSLYFRLLFLAPEDSAEHPFSHTHSRILILGPCWSTRCSLATQAVSRDPMAGLGQLIQCGDRQVMADLRRSELRRLPHLEPPDIFCAPLPNFYRAQFSRRP